MSATHWLPRAQFRECHMRSGIDANANALLTAAELFDDRHDPVLDALLHLREWPARTAGRFGLDNSLQDRPRFGLADFVRLQRTDDTLVFGLVGRFWRPDFGLETIASPVEFEAYDRPGVAKLALAFDVRDAGDGSVILRTETRVYAPDTATRAMLTPYWYAIRPASGWIRRRILRAIEREALRAQPSS